MNDALRIQRSQERIALMNATKDIITNPAVLAIAGVILIEFMQSHIAGPGERDANHNLVPEGARVPGGGFVGTVAGSALEFALCASVVAPIAEKLMTKVNDTAEAKLDLAGKMMPLLLSKGG